MIRKLTYKRSGLAYRENGVISGVGDGVADSKTNSNSVNILCTRPVWSPHFCYVALSFRCTLSFGFFHIILLFSFFFLFFFSRYI